MAKQQYIRAKLAALEPEVKRKRAELEQLEAQVAGYRAQLAPEPKKAGKKDDTGGTTS